MKWQIVSRGQLSRASIAAFFAKSNVGLMACLYLYFVHPQYLEEGCESVGLNLRIHSHTISIGLRLQWNFGKNMHRCPQLTMSCSRIDVLVYKVILLTEQVCHAALLPLMWTPGYTLHFQS